MNRHRRSGHDVHACRQQFPALTRRVGDRPAVFFDGPAGSQVPRRGVDAVGRYLTGMNANHDGRFVTSRESDEMLARAHEATATFLGSSDPDLVAFGANMTTLTFHLARALGRGWQPGDEIVVTDAITDGSNPTPTLGGRDDWDLTVAGDLGNGPSIDFAAAWRPLLTPAGGHCISDRIFRRKRSPRWPAFWPVNRPASSMGWSCLWTVVIPRVKLRTTT